MSGIINGCALMRLQKGSDHILLAKPILRKERRQAGQRQEKRIIALSLLTAYLHIIPLESNINQLQVWQVATSVVLTPPRPNLSPKSSCESNTERSFLTTSSFFYFEVNDHIFAKNAKKQHSRLKVWQVVTSVVLTPPRPNLSPKSSCESNTERSFFKQVASSLL